MKILALDTSTHWLSVALFDGERVLATREQAGNASSERILPAIASLLERDGTPLARLDGVAYGAGPGAFTGVRIACGVAQGLAFGAGCPLVAVSTLEALAQAAWREHRWSSVVACLDARMREIYVATYMRKGNGWGVVREPAVCRPDAVAPIGVPDLHGAGDGFAAYPDIGSRLEVVAVDATLFPDAQAVAELAWPRFASGQVVTPEAATPLYVRHRVALTSAERAAGERL